MNLLQKNVPSPPHDPCTASPPVGSVGRVGSFLAQSERPSLLVFLLGLEALAPDLAGPVARLRLVLLLCEPSMAKEW